MSTFSGPRLQLIREKRGYTKSEMASRMDVSPRLISFWESGERVPSSEQQQRLSRVLRVHLEFFGKGEPVVAERAAVSFRSLASLSSRSSDAMVATSALALELSMLLQDDFNLPAPRLPLDLDVIGPEGAAISLRSQMQLGSGPLPNLVHLVESWGVRVFGLGNAERAVSGLSLWHQGVPFIFVNTASSGERGRFDIAHELAHLVLHHRRGAVGINAEKEADRFAAELLVPSESLLAYPLRWVTADSVVELAREWGVSAMMMVHRLADVRRIRDSEARNLYRYLSSRGFRTSEPGGIARETSQLLSKVVAGYRAEGTSLADVSRRLGLLTSDLRDLLAGLVPMIVVDSPTEGPTRQDGSVSSLPDTAGKLRLVE